ncbi:MAG: hypothetical protein J5679_01785 [Alphaproteobacteria bacterium]|nr:hypothetical protein [Alphaproteobacteria bacterium]
MQLTGPEIKRQMKLRNPGNPNGCPNIIISPFFEEALGSNSYDLHLGNTLKVYKSTIPNGMMPALPCNSGHKYSMKDWFTSWGAWLLYKLKPWAYNPENPKFLLDPCNQNPKETVTIEIPETGLILSPRFGYLGNTVEYTETYNLFPYIDGKSSVGRNFISIHETAGRGDDGFCGNWTLEITVKHPTVVYPNMRIGQIYYEKFEGDRKPYHQNKSRHYCGQTEPTVAAPIPIDKFLDMAVDKQR